MCFAEYVNFGLRMASKGFILGSMNELSKCHCNLIFLQSKWTFVLRCGTRKMLTGALIKFIFWRQQYLQVTIKSGH